MTAQQPPGGDLHDRAADLIEAYSLDALEPEERAIVDARGRSRASSPSSSARRRRAGTSRVDARGRRPAPHAAAEARIREACSAT